MKGITIVVKQIFILMAGGYLCDLGAYLHLFGIMWTNLLYFSGYTGLPFVRHLDQIVSCIKIILSAHHLYFENALNWIEIRVLQRPHVKGVEAYCPLLPLCIGSRMGKDTILLKDAAFRDVF